MKNLIFKYEGTTQCKKALELINKNNKSQYAGKNKLYYSTDSNCYIKEELEDFENITDIIVPASKIIEFFKPKQEPKFKPGDKVVICEAEKDTEKDGICIFDERFEQIDMVENDLMIITESKNTKKGIYYHYYESSSIWVKESCLTLVEEPKQDQVTELEMQVNYTYHIVEIIAFDNVKLHELLKSKYVESVIIKQVNPQFTAFKKVIESDKQLIDKFNECKILFKQ